MSKKILFGFFCLASLQIFSADTPNSTDPEIHIYWPVDIEKPFIISSTFGESRMDHFHNGLDIAGKGIPVYPVQTGRVLWKTEAKFRPGDIPFGGGKTIVLQHAGYWSGYMHLQQINPDLDKISELTLQTPLGKSGDTGHSGGAHLHFFIYDPINKKMINPLPYLETGIYKNIAPPSALGYGILLPDGFVNIDLNKTFKMTKDYPLYARIIDSGTGIEKWGIYTFETYSEDEMKNPIQKIMFDYLSFSDNRWRTSNGKIFENVYFENWLNLGNEFKKNKKVIWKAAGYLGPETKEVIELQIKD
ncbi:MAG: M23 family metallopeptidase [Spirochaetia bacterium]|nr:M23 family metallopeptidase [Spirochaetia bacterium]